MSNETSEPGFVFKLAGLGFMGLGTVNACGLIAAMAFKGIRIENKYTLIFMLVAIGLPFVGGMLLASDKVRDRLLDFASWMPGIPFKKKEGDK